jgi:hypothetical protein
MLATAHVIEGTSDNYIFENDLKEEDFSSPEGIRIFTGPLITVLGTSLQNRDMLERFQKSWNTVGLEMEGGHYQRAISAAMIKGHISRDVKVRYAYYASDNPLISGQTLAAGEMGDEGIRPTYLVSKVILEKVLTTEQFPEKKAKDTPSRKTAAAALSDGGTGPDSASAAHVPENASPEFPSE